MRDSIKIIVADAVWPATQPQALRLRSRESRPDSFGIRARSNSAMAPRMTERLSAAEVQYFREKYSYDSSLPFESIFRSVPTGSFGTGSGAFLTETDVKRAAIGAKYGGQVLLALAEQKLKAVQ